jgi:hypothetical protein
VALALDLLDAWCEDGEEEERGGEEVVKTKRKSSGETESGLAKRTAAQLQSD